MLCITFLTFTQGARLLIAFYFYLKNYATHKSWSWYQISVTYMTFDVYIIQALWRATRSKLGNTLESVLLNYPGLDLITRQRSLWSSDYAYVKGHNYVLLISYQLHDYANRKEKWLYNKRRSKAKLPVAVTVNIYINVNFVTLLYITFISTFFHKNLYYMCMDFFIHSFTRCFICSYNIVKFFLKLFVVVRNVLTFLPSNPRD